MSGISYDFDRRSLGPRRSRDPKRIFRVLLIFCIVAAVTVGAIFLIVPQKKKTQSAPEEKKTENVSDGKQMTENAAGDSADPAKDSAGKESTPDSRREEWLAEQAAGEKEKNPGSSGSSAAVAGKNAKGVVLPEDPSAEEDKPVYPPARTADAEAALAKIRNASSSAEKIAAAEAFLLNEAAAGGEFSQNFLMAGELLAKANEEAPAFTTHKVAKGDYLEKIARKHGTTVEKIRKDNKLKNDRIGIGQVLKILPGKWEVRISRSARVLSLWRIRDGKRVPYAAYSVGVGRKGSTPLGDFTIIDRQYHPKWKDKDKREFPYGDPKNPLGSCFLVFNRKNFGIHGTAEERSVGRSLSSGCIRMRNADAENLFLLLPEKTPVKIVE